MLDPLMGLECWIDEVLEYFDYLSVRALWAPEVMVLITQ